VAGGGGTGTVTFGSSRPGDETLGSFGSCGSESFGCDVVVGELERGTTRVCGAFCVLAFGAEAFTAEVREPVEARPPPAFERLDLVAAVLRCGVACGDRALAAAAGGRRSRTVETNPDP
jgi:hypothetical protein